MSQKHKVVTNVAGALIIVLLVAGLAWFVQSDAGYEQQASAPASFAGTTTSSPPLTAALPNEETFKLAAQNETLQLWVDETTAHFKVVQRNTGQIWRSYPEPEAWQKEASTGLWHSNLLSPIMLEYIDASNSKSQSVITNVMEEAGTIEQFQWLEHGFRGVFHFVKSQFTIPFEVQLGEDYVETRVIDSGITEGKFSLLNLKLYAQFGAQPSEDENGYLLIPDGAGALIAFDKTRINQKAIYQEMVYGPDIAFYTEASNRQHIIMPVYGIKWEDQSFIAVLTEGEEYAKVYAAAAPSLGRSNWVTAEWQYRIKFFQNTDSEGREGFFAYSKDRFETKARTTRYYLLSGERVDYDAMAIRYRDHLIDTYQVEKLQSDNEHIPFYAEVIGADLQEGLLWDDYIAGTTTKEAEVIVDHLSRAGIENIYAIYHGWQRWGYSSYGGVFPVDDRLGGNEGMENFVDTVQAGGGKVLLAASYSLNSSNRGGFWSLRDGLRNLAGKQLKQDSSYGEQIPYMSPRYAQQELMKDIAAFEELGVDGVLLTGGIGNLPYTDFNSKYAATRSTVMDGEQSSLAALQQGLGLAAVEAGALYGVEATEHFHRLPDDYSYDLFVAGSVPFAQIALHGLRTYTLQRSNLRHEYHLEHLRSIEYGAYPAYILTAAEGDAFKRSYSIWQYSTQVQDWLEAAAQEYRELNDALHDVQDQFIVAHHSIAPGVKRTIYENGKQIIVNYNAEDYTFNGAVIPAQGYIALEGGGHDG